MLRLSTPHIAALSAVMLGALVTVTSAAEARELHQDQRFTGAALNLDASTADVVTHSKGALGSSTGRTLLELGGIEPPSEQCAGSDLEVEVLGGSTVEIFNDLSKLVGRITSGTICANLDGTLAGHYEGSYLFGVERFEGASGTFSADWIGAVLTPAFSYPGSSSVSGSFTGTIVLD